MRHDKMREIADLNRCRQRIDGGRVVRKCHMQSSLKPVMDDG